MEPGLTIHFSNGVGGVRAVCEFADVVVAPDLAEQVAGSDCHERFARTGSGAGIHKFSELRRGDRQGKPVRTVATRSLTNSSESTNWSQLAPAHNVRLRIGLFPDMPAWWISVRHTSLIRPDVRKLRMIRG
jgi:hypothetical protein